MEEDFKNGFLDALSNLRASGLSPKEAINIYRGLLNNPVYNFFVAVDGQTVVGTTTLLIEQKFIHQGGKVGHIEDVAVRKGFEGKGIGSLLIARAVAEAKNSGCYKVILDCNEKNIPFYEGNGFQRHSVAMRMDI